MSGDQADRTSNLLTTGEVAKVAGVSRQAVLQAHRSGKLVAVRQGTRGEHLFDRQAVGEWACKVRKRGGRTRGSPATAGRSVLSRHVPSVEADVRTVTMRAEAAGDVALAPALEALLDRVASPKVLEQYEAMLLDEIANRRLAAEVARERIELDRMKIRVERRTLERELRQAERANNVRQLLERFNGWRTRQGTTHDDTVTILRLGQRVLDALGDDLVAEAARGGTLFEDAYLRARSAWGLWLETSGLQGTDPKAHDQFARIWITEMMRGNEMRTAPASVPPAGQAGPKAGSDKPT